MRKGFFAERRNAGLFAGGAGKPRHCVPAARRRGLLPIFFIVLIAPMLPAGSQTLYRCVEPGKPTSFQNDPCPSTAKTTSATDYVPERNRPAPPSVPAPAARQRRVAAGGQLHNIPRATSPSECESAKRRRELVLGKNNQGGNVDIRRQLNDAVARACN